MKIIFMGSDRIALPLLEFLKSKATELWVVSGKDKPVGRGHEVKPNEISAWTLADKVTLHRPEKLDDAFHTMIQSFAPDLIFVMAYGKLLKQVLIDMPRLGIWNIHASALPELRGASPIETAIAMGYEKTAVDLMKMKMAMDVGPVGASIPIEIPETMTSAQLREQIARVSAELVRKNWDAVASDKLVTVTQDDSKATYCRILCKDDGWLDPNGEAKALVNHIRAFAEWPGAAFIYAGERLKVFEARLVDPTANTTNAPIQTPPGTVLEAGERLVVAAGRGNLEVLTLQRAGGKRLGAKEFLQGYPIQVG